MTGNPRNAMVCDTPYLQNEIGNPRFFFYVFNLILSFSTVKVLKKSVRGNFWARTSLTCNVKAGVKLSKLHLNNIDISYNFKSKEKL